MAKNRMINTKFWSDGWVINLDPLDRYLFLYFLTNEHTNICGIYELPIKIIERESDLTSSVILKILKKMSDKILYVDGWICIRNFLKHQKSSGNVKLGIENGILQVPPNIMAKINQIKDIPTCDRGHSPILETEIEIETTVVGDKKVAEKDKKPKKQTEAQQLVTYWLEKHEKIFGEKPVVSWPKLVNLANPRIKDLGFDRMKKIVDKYFICDNKITRENKWDLGTMLSDFFINKLK